MKNYFNIISQYCLSKNSASETLLISLNGEETEYCRFNNAKVRQAGHLRQANIDLTLIDQQRQATCSLQLQLNENVDQPAIDEAINTLRQRLLVLPKDEFILYSQNPVNSDISKVQKLDAAAIVLNILQQTETFDFVGILASGHIYRGFANSLGQSNFFACSNYNLDFSLYHAADKAVKGGISGSVWDGDELTQELLRCSKELELMKREAITLKPGNYDVFLSPTAIAEFLDMLNWGGFSARAHAGKSSPLHRLACGELKLSEKVTLRENSAEGYNASFQGQGFIKPDSLALIDQGVYKNSFVCPRSSLEYNLEGNGADGSERAYAYQMNSGNLDVTNIHQELNTGIYINNLWYLNYSDRNNCRITGMTRFCCYYIENGIPIAPINVLRFDDSLYDLLGDKLEALTSQRQLLMESGSYYERSTGSSLVPGALIRGMTFTL